MTEDYITEVDGTPTDNPEALLLAALLATRNSAELQHHVDRLEINDFYETNYAAVFATIQNQLARHRPCDAASIRSALRAQGENSGVPLGEVDGLIYTLTTVDANPFHTGYYAQQVASASYRRQYAAMADKLTRLAEAAPEDELYDLFIKEGRTQRNARARYDTFLEQPVNNQSKQTP